MADDAIIQPTVASLLDLADLATNKGDYEEAIDIYQEVRRRDPKRWEAYFGVAWVSYLIGDLTTAFQYAPHAIRVEPSCMPAYKLIGILGRSGGVADDAIRYLEIGLQANPTEAVLCEWLIPLYANEGRDRELRDCMGRYASLRGLTLPHTAMLFARQPSLDDFARRNILTAAGLR